MQPHTSSTTYHQFAAEHVLPFGVDSVVGGGGDLAVAVAKERVEGVVWVGDSAEGCEVVGAWDWGGQGALEPAAMGLVKVVWGKAALGVAVAGWVQEVVVWEDAEMAATGWVQEVVGWVGAEMAAAGWVVAVVWATAAMAMGLAVGSS